MIRLVVSCLTAILRTEGQWSSSLDDSLEFASLQPLVLVTQRSTIESVIDIRQKAATFDRRQNRLHMARLKGVIRHVMLQFEPFKRYKDVTIFVCFKDLIATNMTCVAFAGDTLAEGMGLAPIKDQHPK